MNSSEWMDLTVLERKKYNFLGEVEDLTQQLAQALDRNDQVAVRMLLAMRQEPVLHLEEIDSVGKVRREALASEDRARVSDLLKGGEPRSNEERIFQEQAQKAHRLLERVVEADRRVSLRMAGENSFYRKKK